jgi:hypothetical protein
VVQLRLFVNDSSSLIKFTLPGKVCACQESLVDEAFLFPDWFAPKRSQDGFPEQEWFSESETDSFYLLLLHSRYKTGNRHPPVAYYNSEMGGMESFSHDNI